MKKSTTQNKSYFKILPNAIIIRKYYSSNLRCGSNDGIWLLKVWGGGKGSETNKCNIFYANCNKLYIFYCTMQYLQHL